MTDLPLIFTIGLLGSAHCVGMCGGFVVALGQAQRGAGSLHLRQSLYFLGKTATYALFGALAGAAGAAVGLAFSGFQGILSLVLGFAIVIIGLSLCGVLQRLGFAERIGQRFASVQLLGTAIGRLVARGTPTATFGLGMLNGLIPCALVYGLLARAAAAGTPLGGAVVMATFGLGTIPALYLTGIAGSAISPSRRLWLNRLGGVVVVALGVLTMVRGASAFGTMEGHDMTGPGEHKIICLPGTADTSSDEAVPLPLSH